MTGYKLWSCEIFDVVPTEEPTRIGSGSFPGYLSVSRASQGNPSMHNFFCSLRSTEYSGHFLMEECGAGVNGPAFSHTLQPQSQPIFGTFPCGYRTYYVGTVPYSVLQL
jgi:hypothetical protein